MGNTASVVTAIDPATDLEVLRVALSAVTLGEWVAITGSRTWRDEVMIRAVLECVPAGVGIRHGAHWEGADRIADRVARAQGRPVDPMPAEWKRLGRRAGPVRNAAMIATRPAAVIGFRAPGRSNGTDGAIDAAARAGLCVYAISAEAGVRAAEPPTDPR